MKERIYLVSAPIPFPGTVGTKLLEPLETSEVMQVFFMLMR